MTGIFDEITEFLSPSLIIACISILLALFSFLLSRRSLKMTNRYRRQEMRVEWTRHVVSWADKVIAALVEANYLSWRKDADTSEFKQKQLDILVRLSALADQGVFSSKISAVEPVHRAMTPINPLRIKGTGRVF